MSHLENGEEGREVGVHVGGDGHELVTRGRGQPHPPVHSGGRTGLGASL